MMTRVPQLAHIKGIAECIDALFQQLQPHVDEVANQELVMSHLAHPNIVRLHQANQDAQCWHLVMDLAEGVELYELIDTNGRFSEGDARPMFRQVARALHYLHAEVRVVHRDIKRENFIFTPETTGESVAKIVDFGFARFLDRLGNSLVGTRAYMAPELLSGQAASMPYDGRVDMYSSGIMLFVTLTALSPFATFDGSTWEDLSCEAKGLIQSLTAEQPHDRFDAERALCHPWTIL